MKPRNTMNDPFDKAINRTFAAAGCGALVLNLAFAALLIAAAIALLAWAL